MNLLFLTQETNFILAPFAKVMGFILNGIYEFVELFGITNIAVCIILFTFVVKMIMLPLTIKQQKSTKLSQKMSPELTAVQNKYKNKKDPESVRKQQAEMQEIYAKYGTSPMGGCLPLIITLPIMFALYRVIYAVPAYINDVQYLYNTIALNIQSVDGYANAIATFVSQQGVQLTGNALGDVAEFGKISEIHLIDIFSKFNTVQWKAFMDPNTWNAVTNADSTVVEYFIGPNAATNLATFKDLIAGQNFKDTVDEILRVNRFLGLNILDAPGWSFPGILIPIASAASQWAVGKLSAVDTNNQKNNVDNPMGQSMKTMNTVMPLVSGVFCVFIATGVGIYWVANSVFTLAQQFFINKYFDKVGLDELIEKSVEKSNKKREKLGIASNGNKMANVAKTTTKTISTSDTTETTSNKAVAKKPYEASNYKKSNVSYSAGSISANANILKRNSSDKGDN